MRTGLDTMRRRGEVPHGMDQRRQGPYGAVSVSEMAPTGGSLPGRDGRDRLLRPHEEGSGDEAREPDDLESSLGKLHRDEVEVGSRFSFRYLKGERKYKRRMARLLAWLAEDKIKVYDEDVGAERFYYAQYTYGTRYFTLPPASPTADPQVEDKVRAVVERCRFELNANLAWFDIIQPHIAVTGAVKAFSLVDDRFHYLISQIFN